MNYEDFLNWYSTISKIYGLNPDPHDPRHFYDWEAAYNSGYLFPNEQQHWPSQFKIEGHPNLYVNGMDTRTGKRSRGLLGR